LDNLIPFYQHSRLLLCIPVVGFWLHLQSLYMEPLVADVCALTYSGKEHGTSGLPFLSYLGEE
jgi:hypothetical protein